MLMKTTLLGILLMLAGMLHAQTVVNPPFKARSGSIRNITRVERTPESTRLYIHAIFRPHWWIMEEDDSYLEDTATGKKYKLTGAEGIELNTKVVMPDSGEKDFVLIFEPLPKETKSIHVLTPSGSESNTYDLSLVPQKGKNVPPLAAVRGNWFADNGSGAWTYGIYDSITIAHNRIYTNEQIRKKGKRIELTLKDKRDGSRSTLWLTPQKDGNCLFRTNDGDESVFVRQRSDNSVVVEPDNGFQTFFRTDTAYLQGYINGYDPRLGFETGMIYLSDEMTRKDYPTVVQIDKDGTFSCKFILYHPMEKSLTINNQWISFFIEPGQTLTMYIDWEAILARSRARDHYFPIRNTAYMGPSASLSYLLSDFSSKIGYRYDDLSRSQKTLTPNQYKAHMKPLIAGWKAAADSVCRRHQASQKATRLIANKMKLQAGSAFFDFEMSRDYYAQQDTANQALKVKADESYYDFLKEMPLDDPVMLADQQADIFTNRFEYMDPFKQIYSEEGSSSMLIEFTYPRIPLLSFLKEKGVKLSAEQEAIREKQEELAGKKVTRPLSVFTKEQKAIAPLLEQEKELVQEYTELTARQETPKSAEQQQEESDRSNIQTAQNEKLAKDSIVYRLCGTANPLLWQMANVRKLPWFYQNIKTQKIAREYTDRLKQTFTAPVLAEKAELLFEEAYPTEQSASYQLPEGKATDIFRRIIKPHAGKVLFIDFWATTCGPCRAGIEATADLRKKYKNHPEFQFIYITGQKDSPAESYRQYVEKHLKGEASYYVSDTDYSYLRQLFQFNGIPHYVLVEKDGSISKEELGGYSIRQYLEEHFGNAEAQTETQEND